MSTSLSLGLVIGASVASGFQVAMSTVNKTVEKLKTTTEVLNVRQEQLRQEIKSLPEGASGIVKLQHEYDTLGKTIGRVAKQQASLKRSIEAGAQLKQQRADLRTNMTETLGVAAATLLPMYGGVKAAGNHEDNVKDIAITGEFDATQEANLSKTIRSVSLQMNQTTEAVSTGLKSLVAGGIQSADELNKYAPVIAKTATATRAEMEDISNTFLALSNNMKISAADSEAAMNIMVKSTKLGQVEFADMAKWMPQLTPMLSALGMTGKESVAQLASMLQVAKIGAGTADEAGNNLKNLLTKITAPDTVKDFEKVGINLQESLKQSAANGIDPITAMLGLVEKYMSTALTGKDLVTYKEAISEKDNAKSAEMFKSLAEAGNMGQLFQDMQAMSALRALLQNKDRLQQFSAESFAAGNSDLLGNDFAKRMTGFNEQMKKLKITLTDIGITIGEILIPPILELVEFIKPAVNAVAEFAKLNPEIIKWGVGLLAGGLAAKLFTSSIAFAVNLLVKSPINQAVTAWKNLSATFTVAKIGLTNFLPVLTKIGTTSLSVIARIGVAMLTVGKYLLAFGKGLGMGLGMPIVMLGKGIAWLSVLLAGKLVSGFKVAAQAFMVLGRALFMTPLGLIISGVAALAYGAYQLYENWEHVKKWFNSLWQSISDSVWEKTALMSMTIEGWINSVKTWFGDLKTWFASLWQDITGGIVNGIMSVNALMNKILPESMQFNIDTPKVQSFDVPEPSAFNSTRGNVIDQSTVHFSPVINLPAGTPEQTVSTVKQALGISQREFEQRYKQMQRNNQRLNFATE